MSVSGSAQDIGSREYVDSRDLKDHGDKNIERKAIVKAKVQIHLVRIRRQGPSRHRRVRKISTITIKA